MIRFVLFGIPVRIEPWFWITMVFLGGGIRATSSQDWIHVAIFVFAGFLSILVHELGHAGAVRKFGHPTAISLVSFGGYASYPPNVLDRRQSFLVTAAGPAIQLALGALAIGIIRYAPIPDQSLLLVYLWYLVWISIVWALFNCLPIYPLDGGQMFAAIVGDQRKRLVHGTAIVFAAGIGVLAFMQLGSWLIAAFMGYFVWLNFNGLKS